MNTATEIAMERWNQDVRFRAIVQASVVRAMDEYGDIDPDHARQDAHEIALRAAMFALSQAFDEDREITTLRIERDHYKELARQGLMFMRPAYRVERGEVK